MFSELEYDARQAALSQGLNSANALNVDLLCKNTKAMAILIVLLLSSPMTIFLWYVSIFTIIIFVKMPQIEKIDLVVAYVSCHDLKKNWFFLQKDITKLHSYFWYDIYYHFFPILNINTKYIEYNNIPFFLSLRCILLRIVNNIRVFVTFHTISCFLGLVFFRCLVIIIANPNIFDGISQLITTVPRG